MDDEPVTVPSEEELLRRIAAGDREAFGEFFRRLQSSVFRFALHLSGSRMVADDVTQEVFLAVMREASRYQPGRSTPAAWLCGIARNHVRRRIARERAEQPLPEDADLSVVHPDLLGAIARGEAIDALRRALLTLPLRYREAIVLCDLQELSYAEAAQALECAVGTVRSRLHRGRALLADKLAGRATDAPVKIRGVRSFA